MMGRDDLLRSIAEAGYNVGFGAKKHFSTYDIVDKGPGWIGFCSTAFGILALIIEPLSAKGPSAALLIAGMVSLYMSFYRGADYERIGKELTVLFNDLRDLYRAVKAGADIDDSLAALKALELKFNTISISKQILFSDWYAHLKFFGQHQISWIDEQLHFRFWRDKVPFTAKFIAAVIILLIVMIGFRKIYFAYL